MSGPRATRGAREWAGTREFEPEDAGAEQAGVRRGAHAERAERARVAGLRGLTCGERGKENWAGRIGAGPGKRAGRAG